MGLERELHRPMSADAITLFEQITRPVRLDRNTEMYDVGYEAAKADIRDRLSQITGVSDVDLTRGIY